MHKNFSEKTAELIDEEVKKIVNRNFKRAMDILEKNKDKLIKIAESLLEKEVLSSDEIEAIIQGKDILLNNKKPKKAKTSAKKASKTPQKIKLTRKPNLAKI